MILIIKGIRNKLGGMRFGLYTKRESGPDIFLGISFPTLAMAEQAAKTWKELLGLQK